MERENGSGGSSCTTEATLYEQAQGRCSARRERSRIHRSTLGGSGACVRFSLRFRQNLIQKWNHSCQLSY